MRLSNKLVKLTAAVACVFALSSIGALAATKPQQHKERATIKEVDVNQHQLVVAGPKDPGPRRLQWNDKTQFTENGKKVPPSAVKAGERADLAYTMNNGMPVVKSVKLSPARKHSKHPTTSHSKYKLG